MNIPIGRLSFFVVWADQMQAFKMPKAVPTIITGIKRMNLPAVNKQAISTHSAKTNKMTAAILASPQVTLKAKRTAQKNK